MARPPQDSTAGYGPKRNTIKVRICVAVSADGEWGAAGVRDADENDIRSLAWDSLPVGFQEPAHLHWIEAEVPLPTETTIEGKVGE